MDMFPCIELFTTETYVQAKMKEMHSEHPHPHTFSKLQQLSTYGQCHFKYNLISISIPTSVILKQILNVLSEN